MKTPIINTRTAKIPTAYEIGSGLVAALSGISVLLSVLLVTTTWAVDIAVVKGAVLSSNKVVVASDAPVISVIVSSDGVIIVKKWLKEAYLLIQMHIELDHVQI